MKLVSLHITNYGKLSNYDYDFDNISSFCEDNGYGKTTITSFIIAMFYGLKPYTNATKEFVDRKHFYPFKGGIFGGNIEFEYNNKEYRIERAFAEKSATGDSLTVYCKNKQTDELGEVPGETIFGINRESFERILLVNADKIQIESDSDINKKLNNYVENVGEEFDIDKVLEKIKSNKKECSKKKSDLEAKIKEEKNDIKGLEAIKKALDDKYVKLNKAENEMKEAKDEYTKAANLGTVLEKWNYYEEIINEANNKKKALKEISDKYPNGLPSEEEFNTIKEANNKLTSLSGSLSAKTISEEDKTKYEMLKSKFDNHLPSDQELKDIDEKIVEYNDLNSSIKKLGDNNKSDREIVLEKHFFGEKISDEKINSIEEEIRKYNSLDEELKNINPAIVEKEQRVEVEKKNVNKGLFMGFMALSIILLGAGVGLMFVMLPIGICLLILAIGLLIGDMFYYFNAKLKSITNTSEVSIEKTNPEYEKKKKDLDEKKNEILRVLAGYRYDDNNPLASFYQFKTDAKEYNSILDSKTNTNEQLSESINKQKDLEQKLNEYFKSFNMSLTLSYKYLFDELKKDIFQYKSLKTQIDNSNSSIDELKNKKAQNEAIIKDCYIKYSISDDYQIDSIRKDLDDYKRLDEEYNTRLKTAEQYKKENNLVEKPENTIYDLADLEKNRNEKYDEFTRIKDEVENDEEEVSSLDEKNNNVSNNIELKEFNADRIKLYEALTKEINAADERLKEKYVAPIKNRFIYYADLLEKTIGEKVKMDSNYKVSFEREGLTRSSEHLSSGYLAICALCFRLALIDNMFEGELPFIIMDDPFVALDSKRFDKAKSLIKELSKNKQIIYFCCHESRELD